MKVKLICVATAMSLLYVECSHAGALLKDFSKKDGAEAPKAADSATEKPAEEPTSDSKNDAPAGADTTAPESTSTDGTIPPVSEPDVQTTPESTTPAASEPTVEKKKIEGDPVVARIGRKEFRRSEILEIMKHLPPQLTKEYARDKLFGLGRDQKVSEYLMVEQAKKAGIDKAKEFLDRLEQMKNDLLARIFLMKEIVPKTENESALKARHAKYVMEFRKTKEHHLYHIMLQSENDAKAVLAELAKGTDFLKLAKEKSMAPSKEKNGDEGFIPVHVLPSPIKEKLMALKPGEYTKDFVKTEAGFHIFKVTEIRDSAPRKFEECKDMLKELIVQEEVLTLIARLKVQYNVQEFEEDGSPLTKSSEVAAPVSVPAASQAGT